MKVSRKWKATLLIMVMTALLLGVSASAGFRRMPNGKYRYYISATQYISGSKDAGDYAQWTFKTIGEGKRYTYCFDSEGYMLTGWQLLTTISDNNVYHWYYFDRNGRMFKNRTKNGHYLQKNGQMLTNGRYQGVYYGEDGSVVEGYKKKVKPGFRRGKKGTKYMQADGTFAAKKWLCIKNKAGKSYWHYFYGTGYMAKKTWVGSHYVDKYGRLVSGKVK
ncbi:MAG: hypothetical protein Q4B57_07960 [Eubacteriales bacterium]|nr:hypothetical protein [Eubacteriales bacterium]